MAIRFDYSGKIVLVTGGSQGIGLAIAQSFAAAGATVHITGTREEPERYEADLSAFTYHRARLQEPEARRALAARFETLDVLVNNAGMMSPAEYEEEGYREVIEVNLNATADLCYRLKDRLAASKGAIVNVGSVASFLALRETPAYTASKAGVLGFTRAIADQWAREGIRVNMVAPGFIDTQIIGALREDPERRRAVERVIPARRLGRPEDVAAAVLFLAAPEAEYVRGQSLVIDGGLMLR